MKAAHAVGNSPVAANLISTLSYQFANQHDPRTVILLARTALRGAENSAMSATLALLYERIAWAHAKAGDRPATERALAAVERHYDQRHPDDGPTWVYWLDDNETQVMAGRCYVELGIPQRAEPLLVDAVARCDEDHAREAALYRSWLAEAYLQTGDLHGLSRKPPTSSASTPAQDQHAPPTGSNTCALASPRSAPIQRPARSRTSTNPKRIFRAIRVAPADPRASG
ncbi:hypothetical protein [Frankia sp. QA3]|uniref:hypothetical protein n=1 Tax=Frankia sp. QA3 TaxID=710111 RepID=UPI0012FBB474|nr:hypothetical protein [Frankia sp. QA3]